MQTLRDLQEHLKVVSEKDAEIATLTADLACWKDIAANRVAVNIENDALKADLDYWKDIAASRVAVNIENDALTQRVKDMESEYADLLHEYNFELAEARQAQARVKELEAEVETWKQTAGAEADGLESWKKEAIRLREALEKIAGTMTRGLPIIKKAAQEALKA